MPFFWTGGFGGGLLTALVAGATLLTEAEPEPGPHPRPPRARAGHAVPGLARPGRPRSPPHPAFADADLSSLGDGSLGAVLPAERRPAPGRPAEPLRHDRDVRPVLRRPARRRPAAGEARGAAAGRSPASRCASSTPRPARAAGRRAGRDLAARPEPDARHLRPDPRRRCSPPTAGTAPATSAASTTPATSGTRAASTTCSRSRARRSTRRRSRPRCASVAGVRQAYVTDVADADGAPRSARWSSPTRPVDGRSSPRRGRGSARSRCRPAGWSPPTPADVPMTATGKVDKAALQRCCDGPAEGCHQQSHRTDGATVTRAIDCLVNVDFGDAKQPEWMVRVKEDYFKGGDSFFKSPELPELLDDMDANGVERAILLTKARQRPTTAPSATPSRAPDRFALGVGGFNLLRPMKTLRALESFVARPPGRLRRRRAELLGRRHVPAERRRLLPALHQVLRARPAALHEHRHPRAADPRRGRRTRSTSTGSASASRSCALHDPRRRPVVGPRHPADAQVPEPAADDLGVVAEAPARVAAALHAHPRQGPDPLRLRLPGALDGALPRRGRRARPARRGARRLAPRQRRGLLLRRLGDRGKRTVPESVTTGRSRGSTMDARPIDADNHYYEPLDAFTRHLDKAVHASAACGPCRTASGSSC